MHSSLTALAADGRRRALLAMPAGLFAAGLGLGKIVRDCSLTCNVGFRLAPVAILAIAAVTIPLTTLSLRGERRWGYQRWQVGSLTIGAASLVAFRATSHVLLLGQEGASRAGNDAAGWVLALRWTYLAFYVWVGALSASMGVNVFSHLFRLFRPAERERGVTVLPLAFALGGLAASVLAERTGRWFMAGLGWRYETVRDNLMLAMAGCLLLQIPFVLSIAKHSSTHDGAAATEVPSFRRTLLGALNRRLVSRLFAVVILAGVADTALKYIFYWLVSTHVDHIQGRTLYFAAFYSWLNGANLLLIAVGTGRAIRRLGLVLSLASLPFAAALGTAALAVHLAMSVMYGLRVVENSLRSVIYEPALDRTSVRIPGDAAEADRALLKGLGPRTGEGLGALLVLGLAAQPGFGVQSATVVLLAVLLVWLGAVIALRPVLDEPVQGTAWGASPQA